jgi:transcriptional regulator with XRE-family HTH domain
LGLRVRKARIKAGLSQEQAAHQVERSDRWLLKVENGQTDPGYGDLVRLAPVLRVNFEQLVLDQRTETTASGGPNAPQSAVPNTTDPAMMIAEVLRRRGFLQAGMVLTGGIVLGLLPGFEDKTESPELAGLRRALLHNWREEPADLPDLAMLQAAIHAARVNLQASRYSAVLQAIQPLLIQSRVAVDEFDGIERIAGYELLAQTYRLIFNVLRKLGDSHLATVAADRGMQAAQASGNPSLVADLAGCVCVVLSDGHHFGQAIELCTRTADCLRPDARHSDPSSLSIYGQLLLAGAEVAAQAADDRVSDDFYREADAVARRLGADANYGFTAFGPTNIRVHRVHAAVVLGDGERAIRLAGDVDMKRLPILERQAHHLLDVAIGYGLIEKPEPALSTLLTAEQVAAEEVLFDPRARALVADVQQRTHRRGSQVDALAERMGVVGG